MVEGLVSAPSPVLVKMIDSSRVDVHYQGRRETTAIGWERDCCPSLLSKNMRDTDLHMLTLVQSMPGHTRLTLHMCSEFCYCNRNTADLEWTIGGMGVIGVQ